MFPCYPHRLGGVEEKCLCRQKAREEGLALDTRRTMDSLRDTISNISMYDVKAYVRKAQNGMKII
jgi:hypothetical protein